MGRVLIRAEVLVCRQSPDHMSVMHVPRSSVGIDRGDAFTMIKFQFSVVDGNIEITALTRKTFSGLYITTTRQLRVMSSERCTQALAQPQVRSVMQSQGLSEF